MRLAVVIAAVMVLVGLAVALVIRGPARSPGTPGVAVSNARSDAGAPAGGQAPSFRATAISGQRITFPTGRPTAIFFMSGLCPTCIEEARIAAAVQKEFGSRIVVLAIDAAPTDSVATIRGFVQQVGVPIHYPFIRDPTGRLVVAFQVRSTDESAIVADAAGQVVYRGALTDSALRSALVRAGAQA